MNRVVSSATGEARGSVNQAITIDKLAGSTIESDTLRLIYLTILNLSIALLGIGVILTVATDGHTRDKFVDYIGRTASVV